MFRLGDHFPTVAIISTVFSHVSYWLNRQNLRATDGSEYRIYC